MRVLLLALSAVLAAAPAAEHEERWNDPPEEASLQPQLMAAFARSRRDAHSLIGTFDISNMFKKKPRPKSEANSHPSSSSLRAADPLPVILSPSPIRSTGTSTSTRRSLVTLATTKTTQLQSPAVTPSAIQSAASVLKRKKARKSKNASKSSKGTRATVSRSDGTREVANTTRRTAHVAADGVVWPVKHAAVVEGDIVLGGLMMVSTSLAAILQQQSSNMHKLL